MVTKPPQAEGADALSEAVARTLHEREGTAKAWGLKFEGAGEGWARCSMVIRDDMLNGQGFAHGGMMFALADTAFGWACNSRNTRAVAQQASIAFLSPVERGETLTAHAREITLAGRSGVYDVQITADDQRMVAVFQGLSRTVRGAVIEEKKE